MVINYTCVNPLVSGHVAGQAYSLTVNVERFDHTPKPIYKEVKTIDGSRKRLLIRTEHSISVVTQEFDTEADNQAMREALEALMYDRAHVQGHDQFTSFYATISGYTPSRGTLPNTAPEHYFSYSFTLDLV